MSADDIEQELWVRLFEDTGTMNRLAGTGSHDRLTALKTYGHQIVTRETDDYAVFTGQVYYSPDEVRDLLNNGALLDSAEVPPEDKVDLELGFEDLSEDYQDAIEARFLDGVKHPRGGAAYRTQYRAVDALTRNMNRSRRKRVADYHNRTESV